MKEKVLLTGISGFLGSHTAIRLLEKGYLVTGTLRDTKRSEELKEMIARYTGNVNNLSFAEARSGFVRPAAIYCFLSSDNPSIAKSHPKTVGTLMDSDQRGYCKI